MLARELPDVAIKMLRADLVERTGAWARFNMDQKDSIPLV